jgi:hypothetical protein
MLALSAQQGDVAVRSDLSKSFILAGTDPTVLADWTELLTPSDAVLSVNGQTGAVTLDSGDVGALAAANNLSDLGSASTARTNLGLGTAATLNAPSSGDAASGEAVKGSDSRLTDSRTPSGSAGGSLSGTYPNPSLASDSATDTVIGTRTVDDTLSPSSDTASLTNLLSWLAHMVKAITGKSSWRTAPSATLEDAATHIASTSNPHSTTAAQVGALAASSNLSDLGSAGTARTNLGLGTSATLNVASSGNAASGEVVKGNDTRLTDSRTPSGSAGGSLSGTYPNPALASDSGTDTVIGSRTVDQTTAMGGTPNVGNLTTLFGRFGNIVKAITGKTNWSDTPDITLATLSAHKSRHVSGGADAFASTDIIEAVVKRLQETSGPTTLAMGSVADGQFLKRSGTSIVGDVGALSGYATADQSVTSSTTLVNSTYVKFAMEANGIYTFDFVIFFTSSVNGAIKVALNGPGTVSNLRAHLISYNQNGNLIGGAAGPNITAYEAAQAVSWGSGSPDTAIYITGSVENGSTAGDCVLRFAQNSSNATATIVKRGSNVIAHKVN